MYRLRKKTAILLIAIFMISIFAVAIPIQANNSIDTSVAPTIWAIIKLEDDDSDEYYGELRLKGWFTYETSELEPDGTINHVIWEVVYVDGISDKIQVGDNVFSIHGYYEDGTLKWIHNAKDFNLHLETDFGASVSPSYGGSAKHVEGKTYGTRVHGSIEWGHGNAPLYVSAVGHFNPDFDWGGEPTVGHRCSIDLHAEKIAGEWTGQGVFRDEDYSAGKLKAIFTLKSASELLPRQVDFHITKAVGIDVYIDDNHVGTFGGYAQIAVGEPFEAFTFQIPYLCPGGYYVFDSGFNPTWEVTVEMTIAFLE